MYSTRDVYIIMIPCNCFSFLMGGNDQIIYIFCNIDFWQLPQTVCQIDQWLWSGPFSSFDMFHSINKADSYWFTLTADYLFGNLNLYITNLLSLNDRRAAQVGQMTSYFFGITIRHHYYTRQQLVDWMCFE